PHRIDLRDENLLPAERRHRRVHRVGDELARDRLTSALTSAIRTTGDNVSARYWLPTPGYSGPHCWCPRTRSHARARDDANAAIDHFLQLVAVRRFLHDS